MKSVDALYAQSHRDEIISAIRRGSIFIYPTDTIYGIGCDATNTDSVKKIRALKQRPDNPFSVIAPNKEWILEKCVIPDTKELERLPGPYTLILKWKNENPLSGEVNSRDSTIGVRIPDHWFSKFIAEAGVPFVTTSVNISGEHHMESLENIREEIRAGIDVLIYEGPKKGESSTKINLT